MPEVTQAHRLAAFTAMHWRGWTFDAAMLCDVRRRLIEARAAQIRTAEWKATQQRSVVPVKRVRLGSDGHPVSWCTQMARGQFVAADLFPTT
jgi:hypothetical protein